MMTKLRCFFAAALVAPSVLYAQSGWAVSHSQHLVAAQNGWYFANSASTNKLEGQSGPIFGRPISASEVRDSTQTLTDGSHIGHSETDKFYRDGQGRMRTETASNAIIFDPVAGYTYELSFSSKTYTKRPIHQDSVVTIAVADHRSSVSSNTSSHTVNGQKVVDPPHWTPVAQSGAGSNGVTEELPPQILNGVNAKGSRVTIMIPQGAIGNDHELKVVNERWYSDDFKLLLKTINSDPRFGVTTYELQNIVQGEPAASLFQVPADYTEGH